MAFGRGTLPRPILVSGMLLLSGCKEKPSDAGILVMYEIHFNASSGVTQTKSLCSSVLIPITGLSDTSVEN